MLWLHFASPFTIIIIIIIIKYTRIQCILYILVSCYVLAVSIQIIPFEDWRHIASFTKARNYHFEFCFFVYFHFSSHHIHSFMMVYLENVIFSDGKVCLLNNCKVRSFDILLSVIKWNEEANEKSSFFHLKLKWH